MSENATQLLAAGLAVVHIGHAQKDSSVTLRAHDGNMRIISDPTEICAVEFQINLTGVRNVLNIPTLHP
jgi:hypothetical protein